MSNLKVIVRGAYDIQKLRIQMGNRIVGNFKVKLGQDPGHKEDEIDADGKKILADLRANYKTMTEGMVRLPTAKRFKGNEIISNYTELCLIHQYIELEKSEDFHFRKLGSILEFYPVYTDYLQHIRGVGPAMAGVIISEIDINKAKYATSIWRYAGLDVVLRQDENGNTVGEGRSRRKEHLETYTYINKDGKEDTRQGISFNPFLKTKLMGVLGASFLRAGKDNNYAKVYYEYKHRLENHAKYKDVSAGRRHNMATRYMIKRFLADLYEAWRTIEGLEVHKPYEEAKLGMKHTGT